jgi:hypothetical protein
MLGNIANLNPVNNWAVTVVTPQLIIGGTVHTRLRRITDVLNEPDIDHLVLYDATFMEVGSRRVIAGGGMAQVQLNDMLFVHTNGSTESGAEMKTPKQPLRATVIVSPYTIEGTIHMPLEDQLYGALDALTGRFMPVTDARYWAYSVAESPNYVDLLVVNHARSHVAVAPNAEWRPNSDFVRRPPGRDMNPW